MRDTAPEDTVKSLLLKLATPFAAADASPMVYVTVPLLSATLKPPPDAANVRVAAEVIAVLFEPSLTVKEVYLSYSVERGILK